MKTNPTIDELSNSKQFELIGELNHSNIKEFVIDELKSGKLITRIYMFYQLLMIGLLAFVFTKAGIKIVHGNWQPLLYILFGLFFSLSLLIVIHELIHGLALKLVGVPKVSYGGYIRKFIFYAEADLFVLNKRQFVFVALAPLVFVKVITLAGIIVCFYDPVVSLFALVMGIHSFFCSGDIGLLSVFVRKDKAEVFTFDVKEIRKSYFYRRKIDD